MKMNNKPFIIKKEYVKEIKESKLTTERKKEIKENANIFKKNNLKK